jgi:hypothetical protein
VRIKLLSVPFYAGLFFWLATVILKIVLWRGTSLLFLIGLIPEALFFILLFIEIAFSKSADSFVKIAACLFYFLFLATISILAWNLLRYVNFSRLLLEMFFVAIVGLIYLNFGRDYFAPKKLNKIEFDSI